MEIKEKVIKVKDNSKNIKKDPRKKTNCGDFLGDLEKPSCTICNTRGVKNIKKQISVPKLILINKLHKLKFVDLKKYGIKLGIELNAGREKSQLIVDILKFCLKYGSKLQGIGVLDTSMQKSYGFLRWEHFQFSHRLDDVLVNKRLIDENKLKCGSEIKVEIISNNGRDAYFKAVKILEIEGNKTSEWRPPKAFDDLTAMFPDERLFLEKTDINSSKVGRILDLISPLGKGQRGLIAAPPRGGKTFLLKDIASSLEKNYPEIELIILLLDERPEEVTDFRETVQGAKVFASTFDEDPSRHIELSEIIFERAKRLVEMKKDVIILLDSLTRLARGNNSLQSSKSASMSGGLSRNALVKPRKFFGSARKTEEGGSLTILATALIETESRADEVIFEEFKGTGNLEIFIDRILAERRVFPAIHIAKSGTRKEELLYHKDEYEKINILRRQLAKLPIQEAIEKLLVATANTKTNAELLLKENL